MKSYTMDTCEAASITKRYGRCAHYLLLQKSYSRRLVVYSSPFDIDSECEATQMAGDQYWKITFSEKIGHFTDFQNCHFHMLVPIGSKHIVRAMILDDFEPVLSFLHFLKQNEMVPIGSKHIVWAMILDDFEPVLSFLHF